jgi:hypothetical protein
MTEFQIFYNDIRDILYKARKNSYKNINSIMVEAYWLVGKRIFEEEQSGKERADYGEFLIKNLSIELKNDFGNGFSIANLKNFRQFYKVFPEFPKSYALRSQLAWTQQILGADDSLSNLKYIRQWYLFNEKSQQIVDQYTQILVLRSKVLLRFLSTIDDYKQSARFYR